MNETQGSTLSQRTLWPRLRGERPVLPQSFFLLCNPLRRHRRWTPNQFTSLISPRFQFLKRARVPAGICSCWRQSLEQSSGGCLFISSKCVALFSGLRGQKHPCSTPLPPQWLWDIKLTLTLGTEFSPRCTRLSKAPACAERPSGD